MNHKAGWKSYSHAVHNRRAQGMNHKEWIPSYCRNQQPLASSDQPEQGAGCRGDYPEADEVISFPVTELSIPSRLSAPSHIPELVPELAIDPPPAAPRRRP